MHRKDEEEIERIFTREVPRYVSTGDVAGYVSLFVEDAIWCPPDAPNRIGHEQIAIGLSEMLATQSFDPTFTPDEIRVVEDYGYVLGQGHIVITPKGGGPTTVAHSCELWLYRRVRDVWKLSRLIWNIKPT